MDDIMQFMPAELKQAIQTHGFHKLAAKMYGVDEINVKTASEIIGRKLLERKAEWNTINTGLAALKDL